MIGTLRKRHPRPESEYSLGMIAASTLRARALELGFDLVGFAPAGPTPGAERFVAWLAAGRAGEMAYLAREPERRADPRRVLPGCRWVMMVAVSDESLGVPAAALADPTRGRIARYAWGLDYHDTMTPRLRALGDQVGALTRSYVDTGAVMERAWAAEAGLGFIGRNTCLIHPRQGSHLLLGAVLIAADLDLDEPPAPTHPPGCGQCRRCLAACPTGALDAEYSLDARRCISYLTIELKGSIPEALRPRMGNWIFGCDVCQDVCPYVRRFSTAAAWPAFSPRTLDHAAPRLADALQWTPAAFNAAYRGSPLKRAKWRGILRNVCVAAGNSGDRSLLPRIEPLTRSEEGLIAEHAAWAVAALAHHR